MTDITEGTNTHVLAEGILEGLSAVVTGAGTGIGRVVSKRLISLGARVSGIARRESQLEETASEVAYPEMFHAFPCDVRDSEQLETTLASIGEEHGIGLLFNNAGGQFFAKAEEITPNGWNAVVELNLNAVFNATRVAFPYLARARGSVINISLSGVERGGIGFAHSLAARSGVLGLTRALALEWASKGIRVNCLGPGAVMTDALSGEAAEHVLENLVGRGTPMNRATTPEEVAELVCFLASPAGSLMTGQLIQVDGGAHLGAGLHMLPEAYK